jgi:hypothetical protein
VKQLQKVVPPSSIVHPPEVCLKWVAGMRVCQANETAIETKRRSSCPRCYGPRQHDELVGTTDGEQGLHVVQEVVTNVHPARRANGKNTRQGLARRQREGIRLRISHLVGQPRRRTVDADLDMDADLDALLAAGGGDVDFSEDMGEDLDLVDNGDLKDLENLLSQAKK